MPSLYSLQKVCQVLIRTGLIALFLSFIFLPQSYTFAQTSTSTEALIHQLESQIKTLQTRINELEIELGVKPATPASPEATQPSSETSAGAAQDKQLPTFTATLSLNSRGDDVRNLQQFLAQDKEVYPEGLITAYYGPLTEKAIKRFQEKHNIVSTGTYDTTGYGRVGPRTLARVNELLKEGAGKSGIIPPGLLTAPGIQKKVATTTPPLSSGQATTTPSRIATTTPSGTIPATPAQPIGQTGTTTVPATPAQPATGTPPPPPPSGTTPPPSPTPTPSPTPSPTPTPPPSSGGDITAPAIVSIPVVNVTETSATITWLTDEASDSQVEYGPTSSYGSSTTTKIAFVTSHSVGLVNLTSNTLYHYRVKSKDAVGNSATSGDYVFTTLAPPAPPPPPPSTGGAGTQKWAFTMSGQVYGSNSALASDGTIYIVSGHKKLYAINPDGTLKWSFDTSNSMGTPVVASDGTIYIKAGRLHALNSNGTQKWAFEFDLDPPYSGTTDQGTSPALASDGTIYVSGNGAKMYALNPNGTQKWVYSTGASYGGRLNPVVASDGTVYYVKNNAQSSELIALNPNGTMKWSSSGKTLTIIINSDPTIDGDGTIYFRATEYTSVRTERIYAFNPDGTMKWASAGDSRYSGLLDVITIGADGTLYINSRWEVSAFTHSGIFKWSFSINGASPVTIGADGTIYAGGYYNKFFAINSDGTQKWVFQTYGTINSSSVIGSDGIIYVASYVQDPPYDSRLHAIRSDSFGLANSPWPKYQKNNRNTGNASDLVALQNTSQPTLAFILQSLSAALDDIQKQIQKLLR